MAVLKIWIYYLTLIAWIPILLRSVNATETAEYQRSYTLPPWGKSEVIVNTTEEWKTPSAKLLSDNPYTPLWRYHGSTYFVWTDSARRPWVTQLTNRLPVTVPLDPGSDYVAQPDGHHRFSMGIDRNGYIHIAGDMHHYDEETTMAINPYPIRYQKQTVLYWKSKLPESVSGGFAFAGTKGSVTALPGAGWSYGRFFTDFFGELYYSSRVKAIVGANLAGGLGIGLYRYDLATRTWKALGKEVDKIRDGKYYKVLAWDLGGMSQDEWYQGFRVHFKFDRSNRLHFAFSINTDTSLAGNNRLIYAISSDSGLTWKRANGDSIPDLPIRAVDSSPNLGDVVAQAQTTPFLGSDVDVISDRNGLPSINVDSTWRIWTGTNWVFNRAFNTLDVPSPSFGNLTPGNSLILSFLGLPKISFAENSNQKAFGYDFAGYRDWVSLDEHGLTTTGVLYGVGIALDGKSESILKTTVTPAPLPCGWKGLDISSTGGFGYAGMAGYLYKTFVMTNYGLSLGSKSDSFRYVYGKFSGDGSIQARVDSTAPAGNARAGVMIRETLSPQSRFVMMSIGRRLGAIFSFRNLFGNGTYNTTLSAIPNPYWVKLTRFGNTFTGSISSDGQSWTQVSKTTLVLPSTLYIGLASAGYHKTVMQSSRFQNVVAAGCN